MESSNTPDLASDVTTETASPVESSATDNSSSTPDVTEAAPKEGSLKESILARKGKDVGLPTEKVETPETKAPEQPATPPYQANFKYKAFGKEKEVPEFFRSLVKDAESEKQVRDVFTRADAFEDMKGRYENVSQQHQQILNNFSSLDRDVKKVMGFRNKGDFDNFFASLKISDAEVLQYLQQKANVMQDPSLKSQYQQQVEMRAQAFDRDEQLEQLRSDRQSLAVQARTMQLDSVLSRPDVSSIANAWDSKTGELGAFRDLVIREAAAVYAQSQQDIPAEHAVQLVIQRYGKLVSQSAPQAPMPASQQVVESQSPQAPQIVPPKPSIPTLNGKGTSPVKQVPKSLDDIKRMAKEAQRTEYI